MPRNLPSGLIEEFETPGARFREHSTLELFLLVSGRPRAYYFASALLNFDGVIWQPQIRGTSEIKQGITRATNRATVQIQNVDTILGIEFAQLERSLFGAEAAVGRYWLNLDAGSERHDIFLSGVIAGIDPSQNVVELTIVADIYAGVSVGPLRQIRRLCQARPYKGFECGSTSNLSICNYTFGDCQLRHSGDEAFARHMGAPYIDNATDFKLI